MNEHNTKDNLIGIKEERTKFVFNKIFIERAIKIEKLKIKISTGKYLVSEGDIAKKMLEHFGLASLSI